MAIDISHRIPRNTSQVLPVFRQDATYIPHYFIDMVLPELSGDLIKVCLIIFRLMEQAGEDEIITYRGQLASLTGLNKRTINDHVKSLRNTNYFHISDLGLAGTTVNSPHLLKIRFINRVNYTTIS